MHKIILYLNSFSFLKKNKDWSLNLYSVFWIFLFTGLIIYGSLLRIGDQNTRDFWCDELWRVEQITKATSYQNLINKSSRKKEPVQYQEYLLGKLGLKIFKNPHLAFRSSSIIFSLLSLFTFTYIVSHLFSKPIAFFSMFLFFTAGGYIEHAHEFKPYSLEILLAQLPLALGIYIDTKNKPNLSFLFVPVFLILLFFSNIWMFFIFLPFLALYKKDLKNLKSYLLPSLILLSLFIIVFSSLYLRYVFEIKEKNIFLFWSPYYLNSIDNIKNFYLNSLPRTMWFYFDYYKLFFPKVPLISGFLLVLMLIISPIFMIIRKNILAFFVLLPGLSQVTLSVFGYYPFLKRVSAFYIPFLIISLMYLANLFLENINFKKNNSLYSILSIFICSLIFYTYIVKIPINNNFGRSRNIEKLAPLIEDIENLSKKGDIISANKYALKGLKYYKIKRNDLILDKTRPNKIKDPKTHLTTLIKKHPKSTIWIISTHKTTDLSSYIKILKELNLTLIHKKIFKNSYLLGITKTGEKDVKEKVLENLGS